MGLSFRQAAILKVLAGVAIYGWVFFRTFQRGDFIAPDSGTLYIIGLAAPGVLAMIGLFELVSGHSFGELAAKWDALPNWKQTVIAIGTVLGAIVLIFGPLLLIGWLTYDV